jgi:hypothetical protein
MRRSASLHCVVEKTVSFNLRNLRNPTSALYPLLPRTRLWFPEPFADRICADSGQEFEQEGRNEERKRRSASLHWLAEKRLVSICEICEICGSPKRPRIKSTSIQIRRSSTSTTTRTRTNGRETRNEKPETRNQRRETRYAPISPSTRFRSTIRIGLSR